MASATKGSANDNDSAGTSLSDAAIQGVVANAINSGRWAEDAHALYFVLTSPDVTASGFCTQCCGWHAHRSIAGLVIKYSFVGNPDRRPSANQQSCRQRGRRGEHHSA